MFKGDGTSHLGSNYQYNQTFHLQQWNRDSKSQSKISPAIVVKILSIKQLEEMLFFSNIKTKIIVPFFLFQMSLLKDLHIQLGELVRVTPIRDGYHSNTFSYKDYSSAEIKNQLQASYPNTNLHGQEPDRRDDSLMQTVCVTSNHRAVFPLHAHLVSCVCVCYLWTCNGEVTRGRGHAYLCNGLLTKKKF